MNKKRQRTNGSKLIYMQWLAKSDWLKEQGRPSAELDRALARVSSTLYIEYAHLDDARYDEEHREPFWKDAEYIEVYRGNTKSEIGKMIRVGSKIDFSDQRKTNA